GDLGIGVDDGLLIDPADTLQGADIEGVLGAAIAGTFALELAMRFLVGLGFLEGGDLGFGQQDPVLRDLGFERLERRFVLGWEKLGLQQSLGSRIVTYADDVVILCRRGKAEEALHWMRELMGKLKLTVNAEKTRICKVPEREFDFLGFTFGRMYSPRTGQARLALRPSKKSIRRMIETIHELTIRSRAWQKTTLL